MDQLFVARATYSCCLRASDVLPPVRREETHLVHEPRKLEAHAFFWTRPIIVFSLGPVGLSMAHIISARFLFSPYFFRWNYLRPFSPLCCTCIPTVTTRKVHQHNPASKLSANSNQETLQMPKLLVIMLATNTSHQLEPYQIFSCPVNQNTTTSSVSLWLMLSDADTQSHTLHP